MGTVELGDFNDKLQISQEAPSSSAFGAADSDTVFGICGSFASLNLSVDQPS